MKFLQLIRILVIRIQPPLALQASIYVFSTFRPYSSQARILPGFNNP